MQRYSTLVDYILCRRCKLKEVRDCNVVVAESVEPFSGWGRFRWQRHIGESCRQSWKRERVLQALRGWEKLPEDWISDSQWYQRAWLEVYLAWRSFQLGQKEIVRTYYNYQTDNCLTNIEEKWRHFRIDPISVHLANIECYLKYSNIGLVAVELLVIIPLCLLMTNVLPKYRVAEV